MEIDFFFADDSRQNSPTRDRIQDLVAAGGIYVGGEHAVDLEESLESQCRRFGFPRNEPFKWSPGRELWMHDNLKDPQRTAFFEGIVDCLTARQTQVIAVVSEEKCKYASKVAKSHEEDVTWLLFERVNWAAMSRGRKAITVLDRPTGPSKDQERFLDSCAARLTEGTEFSQLDELAIGPLRATLKHLRLIQAADLVISCTLARVAGERGYSPRLFQKISPLLRTEGGIHGGRGLKLHPDFRLRNLYHWLVRDGSMWTSDSESEPGVTRQSIPLPDMSKPYSDSEWRY